MNAIDALAAENARLKAENEHLTAELAQARKWDEKLIEKYLQTLSDESDYWDGIQSSDRDMAWYYLGWFVDFATKELAASDEQHDNVPAYTEETG